MTYIVGVFLCTALATAFFGIFTFTSATVSAATKPVTDIATGANSACAIVNLKVKCWGSNGSGQLGNRSKTTATSPVTVDTAAARVERKAGYCKSSVIGICTLYIVEQDVAYKASALNGRSVKKVSVGKDHACALADARVVCWGDNSNGELGNGDKGYDSTVPVSVDTRSAWTETVPGYCNGEFHRPITGGQSCAFPSGNWVNERKINHKDSALKNKEIIDVSAGEDFTCALASDGMVACWGSGANGRLGNGDTNDRDYPVAINTQGAFAGKRGKALAKAAGGTMCVTATSSTAANTTGTYCWGNGIDDGRAIPGNASAVTACDKNSPTSRPGTTSSDVIFSSSKPTAIPGATIAQMDGDAYVTGLGTDNKAYYWGQYGYRQSVSYANAKTCKVNPCTGKVTIQREEEFDVALAYKNNAGQTRARQTQTRSKTSNPQNAAKNQAKQIGGSARGNDVYDKNGNYVKGYAKDKDKNQNNSQSCTTTVTHYGYTKNLTHAPIGQKVATISPVWPQSQAGISVFSGDVYGDAEHAGLFCAVIGGVTKCDAHGGSTTAGQVGNGSSSQVSGGGAKSGHVGGIKSSVSSPQNVVTTGWLAGKQITELSTGKTGYTCAIASGALGCWGVNNNGQLGVGDTKHKNVPTGVGL